LKHKCGVGVEKIRLRTPLLHSAVAKDMVCKWVRVIYVRFFPRKEHVVLNMHWKSR